MISVVIPTLNAAERLAACLDALRPEGDDRFVGEIIVADGGSSDGSVEIAKRAGAHIVTAPAGRGEQLRAGAAAAGGDWLLFLHGDTVLEPRWVADAGAHMGKAGDRAAVFTLAFDAGGFAGRMVAAGAMMRTGMFRLPYGDQGLLVSRTMYDAVGAYRSMPLFEDVDIVRRLVGKYGRNAFRVLPARATTSAARYRRVGYVRRVIRNNILLARYFAGASPEKLAKEYR